MLCRLLAMAPSHRRRHRPLYYQLDQTDPLPEIRHSCSIVHRIDVPPFPTSAAPAKLATPYRIAAARCPMTDPIDYSTLQSAIGLNWYQLDPNLRSLMDQYLS